jgi:Leucine-rich repeat (LRR) protein
MTQSLLTSFINNITLSNRSIVVNGPTPEDQALTYLIVNDTTFNFSQLLTLNSVITNKVQFRIRQRYALMTLWFQQAFTNTAWTNTGGWLVNANECGNNWYGIGCAFINLKGTVGMQNVVTTVDLYENNMKGTISADLGLLTALNHIDVGSNALTSTLPASIEQWTSLKTFSAYGNALNGTLPASIGQWTALTRFVVSGNKLTGTLPASIGQWHALATFGVSTNALTGKIPASIGNWSQIQYAYFHSNQFTGTMPNDICLYIDAGDDLFAACEICPMQTCCTGCY